MAVKELMTWIPKRQGWIKNYRGKIYTVSARQLKAYPTKDDSREAANQWWETKQAGLTLTTFPHNRMADWYEAQGDPETAKSLREDGAKGQLGHGMDWMGISEAGRAVWGERFRQLKKDQKTNNTLKTCIDRFTDYKKQFIGVKVSLGRWDNLRRYLSQFSDFCGSIPIENLNGSVLSSYHAHLTKQIKADKFSEAYAHDSLAAVKQFVKWAWENNLVDELPRNIKASDISITIEAQEIKTLTLDEIKGILAVGTGSIRLYNLLCLNFGFTTIDISNLKRSELDLKRRVIIRKRTKTKKDKGVPTVEYALWDETVRLLKQLPPTDKTYVFINGNGLQLVRRELHDDKISRVDSIAKDFQKWFTLNKIKDVSLKQFRSAASSLIANSEYARYYDYYLGHAPRGIGERNYAVPNNEVFSQLLTWLGGQILGAN